VLVALAIAFGLSGYRQGLLVGALSLFGFVGGALLGAQVAPGLSRAFGLASGGKAPGFGLVCLVVGAVLGQVAAAAIGVLLRSRLTWRPLRSVDAVAGAVMSAISVLLVCWGLAQVVVRTQFRTLAQEVSHSEVLAGLDAMLPSGAQNLLAALLRLVDDSGFPRVFGGFGAEQIVPVEPPDPAVANQPGVRQAEGSIVKITGSAPSCSRRVEGTGFVFASEHVMTNAHVVAGVRKPVVYTNDQQVLPATVVLYDSRRDVAVLDVPGLRAGPLRFAPPVGRGASAAVAGFPEDAPRLQAGAARIRSRETIRGPDIYQQTTVTREVYVLYAQVRPGNSGGPLLAPDGAVDGVVFAASTQDGNTGYALTAAEVRPDATAGRSATAPVSTRSCD
jgi:S1-C subfamily serine protease